MSQDGLVPISLDGIVAFFTCLAIVIGVVLWREHKRKVRRREEYLAQFNSTHLRMSRYKIGLVYRVVAEADDEVTIVKANADTKSQSYLQATLLEGEAHTIDALGSANGIVVKLLSIDKTNPDLWKAEVFIGTDQAVSIDIMCIS